MTDYIKRKTALEDFERCNAENPNLDTAAGENALAPATCRRRCGGGALQGLQA